MKKDSGWLQMQNCGSLHTIIGSIGGKNGTNWRWD